MLVVLIVIIGFFGLRSLSSANDELNAIYRDNLLPSNSVNKMLYHPRRQPISNHARSAARPG